MFRDKVRDIVRDMLRDIVRDIFRNIFREGRNRPSPVRLIPTGALS